MSNTVYKNARMSPTSAKDNKVSISARIPDGVYATLIKLYF